MDEHIKRIVDAIDAGKVGPVDSWAQIRDAGDGAYMIQTPGLWTDSGQPRDIVLITPIPLDGTRVVPVYPATNPEFVTAVEEALAYARAQAEQQHPITNLKIGKP